MTVTPALRSARFSQQFLAAALKVQRPALTERETLVQRPSLVAFYLVGHAIELALKSYLIARGLTVEDLRGRKYGHKLNALLAECRKRRIGLAVKLSAKDLQTIRGLNETYAAKELEYQFGGSRTLPPYADLVNVAERLSVGMLGYANKRG